MEMYKTLNTNEEIPDILYVFQLYDNTPLGRIYNDSFQRKSIISSAGISNLLNGDNKIKFMNGDINYNNILDNDFSNSLSKFGFENINNEFEVEIENYRKSNYKNYPSRLACLYAFADYETCKMVSQIYKWNLNEVQKFKIVSLHSACKVHMEIISSIKDNIQFLSNDIREGYYKKYWNGEKIDEITINNNKISVAPIYEYLIEGELQKV